MAGWRAVPDWAALGVSVGVFDTISGGSPRREGQSDKFCAGMGGGKAGEGGDRHHAFAWFWDPCTRNWACGGWGAGSAGVWLAGEVCLTGPPLACLSACLTRSAEEVPAGRVSLARFVQVREAVLGKEGMGGNRLLAFAWFWDPCGRSRACCGWGGQCRDVAGWATIGVSVGIFDAVGGGGAGRECQPDKLCAGMWSPGVLICVHLCLLA